MMVRRYMKSPLGILMLEGEEGLLQRITLCPEPELDPCLPELFDEAVWQLMLYFRGESNRFFLPILPQGTEFDKLVWKEMRKIPYGETITYGELARRIGKPTAVRAVAQAVGRNPLPILQPCHRVVAAKGIGGFAWGADAKKLLLDLEAGIIPE